MTPLCHGLRIRWATRQDRTALNALYRADMTDVQPMESLHSMASSSGGSISRLVYQGSSLVGHALFLPIDVHDDTPQSPRFVGMASLFVHPNHRGLGIGSMLVEDGIRACTARGHEALYSATHADFLMRFGFLPYLANATGHAPRLWVRPLSYRGLLGWQGEVQFHPMILRPDNHERPFRQVGG
ncbi:GCN5-related N-acetyltransferase [Magnetococcus marinus MC-1]|uniref:GCN5-related N-acetyltransferase n=1 Tax=Magnetococcus marinus (strain ATCC BAA-1437 / JCM 17883 / MC-1) TaxID=156889 RepID=A0LB37_MAGMM|nr:GNAT family N-acetyltransferase [Magnetococcus marinus]ABK45180.1 GCN5-related N-acetyltransferase [Magnetococcus marinus MC-1]